MVVSLLSGAGLLFASSASAAELQNRSLEISDSTAGANNVTYTASFTLATAGALGSISFEFCSNSPLLTDACTAPNGLSVTAATITSQSGATGFSISNDTTANDLILTRPSTVSPAVAVSYTFTGITNPSAADSYYGRFQTYASTDASGPMNDGGGVAFALNNIINVNAYVPPYLLFCSGNTISAFDCSTANGSYLDLGAFSDTSATSGTNQFVVTTNGDNGYSVSVSGTALESGVNTIAALTSPTSSQIGVNQFGINLRANTNPNSGSNPIGPGIGAPAADYNTPNEFKYVSGDTIASAPRADDYRKFTVTYLVNIKTGDPVGIYTSTFTYIALANF